MEQRGDRPTPEHFSRRVFLRKVVDGATTVGFIGGLSTTGVSLTDKLFAAEERRKITELKAFGTNHNIPKVIQEADQQLEMNDKRHSRDNAGAGGGLLLAILSFIAKDRL
jgi:hypothetical protein